MKAALGKGQPPKTRNENASLNTRTSPELQAAHYPSPAEIAADRATIVAYCLANSPPEGFATSGMAPASCFSTALT